MLGWVALFLQLSASRLKTRMLDDAVWYSSLTPRRGHVAEALLEERVGKMRRLCLAMVLTGAITGCSMPADIVPQEQVSVKLTSKQVFVPEQYRSVVECEYALSVVENPYAEATATESIPFVHGYLNAAPIWGPLVEEMIKSNEFNSSTRYFIAVDLPNHGASECQMPAYGVQQYDWYQQVLVDVLTYLNDSAGGFYHPTRAIVGHSMGTQVLMMAQESLLQANSSLHQEFNVERAWALSTLPTSATDWAYATGNKGGWGSDLLVDLLPLVDFKTLRVETESASEWIEIFCSPVGYPAENCPDEVTTDEIRSSEPYVLSLEMGGLDADLLRINIRAGAFSENTGTEWLTTGFLNDEFVEPEEVCGAGQHLRGESITYDCSEATWFYQVTDQYMPPGEAGHSTLYTQAWSLAPAFPAVAGN